MQLHCRPEQSAWIDVPNTPENRALGLAQIHGHVVVTKRLVPPTILMAFQPCWVVEPEQHFKVVGPVPPGCPSAIQPGRLLSLAGVPDAWLRPLADFDPAGELQEPVQTPAPEVTR